MHNFHINFQLRQCKTDWDRSTTDGVTESKCSFLPFFPKRCAYTCRKVCYICMQHLFL